MLHIHFLELRYDHIFSLLVRSWSRETNRLMAKANRLNIAMIKPYTIMRFLGTDLFVAT